MPAARSRHLTIGPSAGSSDTETVGDAARNIMVVAWNLVRGAAGAMGDVEIQVEHRGRNPDPAASAAGYGMRSIRESLRHWHGHMDIDSSPGFGTRITLSLPIRRWRL